MYSSFFQNKIDSFEIEVTEVQQQNQAWRNMQSHWGLIEDLVEGTSKIRGKSRIYLKQEPREEDESYDVRLSRSVCPPYYVRMERMLAGMLTRKPVRPFWMYQIPLRNNYLMLTLKEITLPTLFTT